jgi:glycerol-3-phosphate dehydrogenase
VAEDAEEDTKNIARKHVIEELNSGLLSLMGGKWTIYRKMGEDLVDVICQKEKEKGK